MGFLHLSGSNFSYRLYIYCAVKTVFAKMLAYIQTCLLSSPNAHKWFKRINLHPKNVKSMQWFNESWRLINALIWHVCGLRCACVMKNLMRTTVIIYAWRKNDVNWRTLLLSNDSIDRHKTLVWTELAGKRYFRKNKTEALFDWFLCLGVFCYRSFSLERKSKL